MLFNIKPNIPIQKTAPKYYPPIGGNIYSAKIGSIHYAYLPILKNAHCWVSKLFEENLCFTRKELRKLGLRRRYIIILRDPVERWVAGIAQYMSGYDLDFCTELFTNERFIKFLFELGRLDTHSNRQLDVIFHYNINKCIFFKCDDSLEDELCSFIRTLRNDNNLIINDNYHRYDEGSESKRFVYEILKEKLLDPEYLQKVQKYVDPDVQLLDYITHNNLWYAAR
jgi:hypothetical protein